MSEGRKLVISVVVVVLVLAGVSLWLFLGMKKTRELKDTITKETAKLEGLKEKITEIPRLSREQKKLAGELEEYETILPNHAELSKIFDTISEVQKKAGVQIIKFEPGKERRNVRKTTETSYRKVSYDLELEGDYFSLAKFVNLLENHNRFMQVDSFSVKQHNEDSPVNDVKLKVSTFVYNPKSKPAPSPSRKNRATAARQKKTRKPKAPEVPFDLKEELAQRYVFRDAVSRRDPFSNPLTKHLDGSPLERPDPKRILRPEREKEVTERIETQLTLSEKMLDQRRLDDVERLLADSRDLMSYTFRDPECYRRQFRFGRRAQKIDFMLRMARGEDLCETIRKQQERMVKAFDQGDYETVYDIRDAVKETLENAADNVIHHNLDDIREACDALCARADTRREFENVVINVDAMFWCGRREKRTAAAIINGQTLLEGDRLTVEKLKAKDDRSKGGAAAVDGDVVVSKIDRSGITFRYKNELILKMLEDE